MPKLVPQHDDSHIETGRATQSWHEEWLIDQAVRDSFPASDPASTSQPGSLVNERYAEPVFRT